MNTSHTEERSPILNSTTSGNRLRRAAVLTASVLGLAVALIGSAQAQIVITGPNISGTWSPPGPYIIVSDCTVPSGQTLTIQPGTVVWIGQGVSLTANGLIQAVGTPAQRITFQAPISSQTWNTIAAYGTAGTNQFRYCDFSNATNALVCGGSSKNDVAYCTFSNATYGLSFRDYTTNTAKFCNFVNVGWGIYMTADGQIEGQTTTQTTVVMNCAFTNCNSAVYGTAAGRGGRPYQPLPALLSFGMRNCTFDHVGDGCSVVVYRSGDPWWSGIGYGSVQVMNNVFYDVTNSAVALTPAGVLGAGGGPASLLNNTVVGAGNGVIVESPWDATIQSCVFKGCSTAVSRSGSLSTTVSYNDFYANTTNFTGFPVTYGQVILANRNGTPCDLLFNIFQNPLFISASDFRLQGTSLCIDAGEGSPANFDSCRPNPSLGSVTNDIGAYGGPGACQWVLPESTNIFTLAATIIPYASVTINPPSAGHYRLEYASELLGTNVWIQLTNMDLTTLPFTYLEPATAPSRFYRAVEQ